MFKYLVLTPAAIAIIMLSSAAAFAGDLDNCIKNYCSYSCAATATCGFQSQAAVSSCKRSCRPAAKNSLNKLKSSKRLKTCRSNNSAFHKLSCDQIGIVLGLSRNNGGGNTKRMSTKRSFGRTLGNSYED
jgi:hypothetical protein